MGDVNESDQSHRLIIPPIPVINDSITENVSLAPVMNVNTSDAIHRQTNSLSLCFWNVRSICNKIRSVISYLSDNDVNIAFISKTWLSITLVLKHILSIPKVIIVFIIL